MTEKFEWIPQSRMVWQSSQKPTDEFLLAAFLAVGCLQRIAGSFEKMVTESKNLERQVDQLVLDFARMEKQRDYLRKRVLALEKKLKAKPCGKRK